MSRLLPHSFPGNPGVEMVEVLPSPRPVHQGLQTYLDTLKGLLSLTLPGATWQHTGFQVYQAANIIQGARRNGYVTQAAEEGALAILHDPVEMPPEERIDAICTCLRLGAVRIEFVPFP